MENIVLYCKSYSKDFYRLKLLKESIDKYNYDNIPFFISTPLNEKELLQKIIGTEGYTFIADEEISLYNKGWNGQQIIKLQFYKLKLTKNYLVLDSDSLFIKPFYQSDFIYKNDIPYTVCHQQKSLFDWSHNKLPFDPQESFQRDRKLIMNIFKRKGAYYDFGPSPVIWSSKVLESLEDNYLKPNNLSINNLIQTCTSEFSWYGEYLLAINFPLYPLEPIFKVYHYKNQYLEDKQRNITLDNISKNYLGIILQSNWGAPLEY